MARTTYEQLASNKAQQLITEIFKLGGIGYVALCCGQEVLLREAPGMVSCTTAETNFYEELLVNPILLKLASQRADLDCGGLDYIAVGYGDFVQLIMLIKDGHISMGISRKTHAGELAARVKSVLQEHGQTLMPTTPWLLV
jgi:hypothetical protein